MFTGIVMGTRAVSQVLERQGGRRLRVQLEDLAEGLQRGASVAINGTCLTAVEIQDGWAEFDVIQESLQRTNLGALQPGERVNIERAARFGDEIGGHQVNGHVDTTGTIREIRRSPNNQDVFIQHDPSWARFLVPKGWIALDGISLTVVDVFPDGFSVSLIPETLERTLMGERDVGGVVNLEFDHLAKLVYQTTVALLEQGRFRLPDSPNPSPHSSSS
ncbi:MAG: riboflavin synthase subunit alpha [bacterium]|jgi:riboflavin synthase